MSGPPRQLARWPDFVIVLATTALAFALVCWSDRDFLALNPPSQAEPPHMVSRPDWVWTLHYSYQRMQPGAFWIIVAATVGIGLLVARDGRTWTRRGLARPATVVVAVALLVGGVTVAHHLLAAPKFFTVGPTSYQLYNTLSYRMPGTILGAWAALWLAPRRRRLREQHPEDWRQRIGLVVGWLWLGDVGLLIAYGLLFG